MKNSDVRNTPDTTDAALTMARDAASSGDYKKAFELVLNTLALISQGTAQAMREAGICMSGGKILTENFKKLRSDTTGHVTELKQRVTTLEEFADKIGRNP